MELFNYSSIKNSKDEPEQTVKTKPLFISQITEEEYK